MKSDRNSQAPPTQVSRQKKNPLHTSERVCELAKPSLLRIRLGQRRQWLNFNDVQPALSLARARPAPRPGIFTRLDGPRAMRATDARIILIMKRVIRYVVFVEIAPNLFRSPIRDRIHLD